MMVSTMLFNSCTQVIEATFYGDWSDFGAMTTSYRYRSQQHEVTSVTEPYLLVGPIKARFPLPELTGDRFPFQVDGPC